MAGKHVTQFVHDMCLGVFLQKKRVGAEVVMNTAGWNIYTVPTLP